MSEFNLYDDDNSNNNETGNGYYDPETASYYARQATSATSSISRDSLFARKKDSFIAEGKIVSAQTYYLTIILCLLWGFGINYILCKFLAPSILDVNMAAILIFYFISCLTGIMLYKYSTKPVVSFIGYNLIVLPIGILLSVVLQAYNPMIVTNAFLTTALITAVMCVMGYLYPQVFEKITSALAVTLLTVIVAEFFLTFIFRVDLGFIDYLIALIFAGYIAVDLGRASRLTYTLDNAIDVAAELYLDIINLFIRILSILAKSKD